MREYVERSYRGWMRPAGLRRFEVKIRESDLLVLCDEDLERLAREELHRVRSQIEAHIDADPDFLTSLVPRAVPDDAPEIVRAMAAAGAAWDVGPMAAVAGAIAEAVGRRLLEECTTVMVENGGDVFARSDRPVRFRLYAGEDSPFTDRIDFSVDARDGMGICTSSGKVGPSLSFGRADALVAITRDAALADAAATSLANRIQGPGDVEPVVDLVRRDGRLAGTLACAGDRIGVWGEVELIAYDINWFNDHPSRTE